MRQKGKKHTGGLLLPGSSPIHVPLLCLRHGREVLGTIYCLLLRIPRRRSAGRSTSKPRVHPERLPVFPSQLCEEASHPSEGGSIAAPLPRPINSFSTATCRQLQSCTRRWQGPGQCCFMWWVCGFSSPHACKHQCTSECYSIMVSHGLCDQSINQSNFIWGAHFYLI